ncbi:UNKNOWN [Stylonychia lemnae]|uniref:Uncharacterized protein n=1 Tax=Stylonychia lemnae TaxID=5949 RepID=A0A078B545_STYLE|nr:UNKNOWN [Stylonychia lemnae]|eukprot:CDW88367.1 UNKNOWN [Stylonychia lemnae]
MSLFGATGGGILGAGSSAGAGGGGLFGGKGPNTPSLQKTVSSTNLLQDITSKSNGGSKFFPGPGTLSGNTGASTSTQNTSLTSTGGSSLFGAPTATTTSTGTTGQTSLFGQQAENQPPAGGGLFGSAATQQQPDLSKQTSLFGGTSTQLPSASPSLFNQQSQQNLSPIKTGGLFGGGAATGQTSLFGQTATSNQPQGSSIFGATPQQTALGGSIFGGNQPAAGSSLFGNQQQQQQQTGLFGQQPSQQMQQQQFAQQNGQLDPNMISQMFFQVRDPKDATDILRRVMALRPINQPKIDLASTNPYKSRMVKDLGPNEKQVALEIQQRLDKQKEIKGNIPQQMSTIKTQIDLLRSNMTIGVTDIQIHYKRALLTKVQIQNLQNEVMKIAKHREQLLKGITQYDNQDYRENIKAPFKFFQNLHQEHTKILEQLNFKLDEATGVVDYISKNKTQNDIESQQTSTKQKVFEVLKLIYQQQKDIGQQLFKIDQCVKILRTEFTNQMIKNGINFVTREDVDAIFKKYGNFELDRAIKEIEQKATSKQLSSQFDSLLNLKKDAAGKDQAVKQSNRLSAIVFRQGEEFSSIIRQAPSQLESVQGLVGQKRQSAQPISSSYIDEGINPLGPLQYIKKDDQEDFQYFKSSSLFRTKSQLNSVKGKQYFVVNQPERFRPSQTKRQIKALAHLNQRYGGEAASYQPYQQPSKRRSTFQSISTMDSQYAYGPYRGDSMNKSSRTMINPI